MAERRAARGQSFVSWFCLLLFCLAAPLALLLGWARLTVRDEDVYARAAREAAGTPRVQESVVRIVTTRVEEVLVGENPTASEAIRSRAVLAALGEATRQVMTGEQFLETWDAAHRAAHRLIVAELAAGRGQPVTLDLSPLAGAIAAEIARVGVELPAAQSLDAGDLRIAIADAATADRIRLAAARLDLALWGALAMAIGALLLSIGFARDRLAGVARAGFGLAVGMVVSIALLVVAEGWLASAEPDGGAVIAAMLAAVSQGLRVAAIALALVGLIVASVFAGLRSLRSSTVRRGSASAS